MTLPATVSSSAATLDDAFYEVVSGEVVELEPMGAFESVLATFLQQSIIEFLRGNRIGMVFPEVLFLLDGATNLQRRPDLAFVSHARWKNRPVPRTGAWDIVPDLAIEVVSPTNRAEEVDRKVTEYFSAGVRLVWVLFPDTERIYIHRSPNQADIIQRAGELDGGDVLPGFRLAVDDLFSQMPAGE